MNFKNYLEANPVPAESHVALMDAVTTDDSAKLELLINTLPMSGPVRNDLNIIWAITYDENHE